MNVEENKKILEKNFPWILIFGDFNFIALKLFFSFGILF